MKKVLIIGFGDIGKRVSLELPDHQIIGVSRNAPKPMPNLEFIQWDWFGEENLAISSTEISAVILVPKPATSDLAGYKAGFMQASKRIMTLINKSLNYERLILISSTRVYGKNNGRNIDESSNPMPDDEQGKIILDYEQSVSQHSQVSPLILRPSGLYDPKEHWIQKHVNSFDGNKRSLGYAEANMFSRANLARVIGNYIKLNSPDSSSGPLICSEPARSYQQIFDSLCPDQLMEDFFHVSDQQGKTFNPQKLIESGLMR